MGSVWIQGDVSDLSSLGCLTSIGGKLHVAGTTALENVDALSALTSVGEDVLIGYECTESTCRGNEVLRNLDGLANLATAGVVQIGSPSHDGNPRLESVGLEHLEGTSSLTISGNSALAKLSGFDALTSVDSVVVEGNLVVAELSGFGALTSVPALAVNENPELGTISGFDALESADSISLVHDAALTSVAFEALSELDSLTIIELDALTSVAFEALSELDSLTIIELDSLTTLHGFASLTRLYGLEVRYNRRLPACEVDWLIGRTQPPNPLVEHNDDAGTCA